MRILFVMLAFLSAHAMAAESLNSSYTNVQETHVIAASPTPMMTGFIPETKSCVRIINDAVPAPTGLALKIVQLHENGHCEALKLGLQHIEDGTTRYGETFADIFALASLKPEELEEGFQLLLGMRSRDRQSDGAYNTVFAMVSAKNRLPTKMTPLDFTVQFFKE